MLQMIRLQTARRQVPGIRPPTPIPRETGPAYPRCNLMEEGNLYRLTALTPGLGAEDLEVSLTGQVLTIAGRRQGSGRETRRRQRAERPERGFRRDIRLPGPVRADSVKARSSNGVLAVSLEKAPGPFLVEIQ